MGGGRLTGADPLCLINARPNDALSEIAGRTVIGCRTGEAAMLSLIKICARLTIEGVRLPAALVAVAMAGAPALAQTPAPQSEAVQPQPPAGMIVTPPRAIPRELLPDALRGGVGRSPDRAPADRQPSHGGCRYDEQKLELLV